jgi:hypothetical protein
MHVLDEQPVEDWETDTKTLCAPVMEQETV